MNEVTRILSAVEQGDPHAPEQLLPLVYDELRQLAAEKMSQEQPGQTLQATALVHEAYLRLVDTDTAQHWETPAAGTSHEEVRCPERGAAPHRSKSVAGSAAFSPPHPLGSKAPSTESCQVTDEAGCPLASAVQERSPFETFLADLSATFLSVPADQVSIAASE
jgi:hypothetical protein